MNTPPHGPTRRLEHAGHRGLPHVGELAAVEHAEGQQRHQNQQAEHAHEAEDGGEADILAAPGIAGIDAGALDTDEHEDRDEHGAAHLGEHLAQAVGAAAPEIAGELVRLEEDEHDNDENADRHDLGDRHDLVDSGRFLDAAQDHEMDGPQDDRGKDHGDHGVAVAEDRE